MPFRLVQKISIMLKNKQIFKRIRLQFMITLIYLETTFFDSR